MTPRFTGVSFRRVCQYYNFIEVVETAAEKTVEANILHRHCCVSAGIATSCFDKFVDNGPMLVHRTTTTFSSKHRHCIPLSRWHSILPPLIKQAWLFFFTIIFTNLTKYSLRTCRSGVSPPINLHARRYDSCHFINCISLPEPPYGNQIPDLSPASRQS